MATGTRASYSSSRLEKFVNFPKGALSVAKVCFFLSIPVAIAASFFAKEATTPFLLALVVPPLVALHSVWSLIKNNLWTRK